MAMEIVLEILAAFTTLQTKRTFIKVKEKFIITERATEDMVLARLKEFFKDWGELEFTDILSIIFYSFKK